MFLWQPESWKTFTMSQFGYWWLFYIIIYSVFDLLMFYKGAQVKTFSALKPAIWDYSLQFLVKHKTLTSEFSVVNCFFRFKDNPASHYRIPVVKNSTLSGAGATAVRRRGPSPFILYFYWSRSGFHHRTHLDGCPEMTFFRGENPMKIFNEKAPDSCVFLWADTEVFSGYRSYHVIGSGEEMPSLFSGLSYTVDTFMGPQYLPSISRIGRVLLQEG